MFLIDNVDHCGVDNMSCKNYRNFFYMNTKIYSRTLQLFRKLCSYKSARYKTGSSFFFCSVVVDCFCITFTFCCCSNGVFSVCSTATLKQQQTQQIQHTRHTMSGAKITSPNSTNDTMISAVLKY